MILSKMIQLFLEPVQTEILQQILWPQRVASVPISIVQSVLVSILFRAVGHLSTQAKTMGYSLIIFWYIVLTN